MTDIKGIPPDVVHALSTQASDIRPVKAPGSPSSGTPAADQTAPAPPPGTDADENVSSPEGTNEFSEKSGQKRPGGDAQVKAGREGKEQRLRQHHRDVEEMVREWTEDLPTEMRGRALVRVSLTNMARAQLALDCFLDRVVRGEKIPVGEQESMRKLASDAQAFKGDLLSRWPREERAPVKPVPASVNAWLDSLCDRCYPVPSAECGCAALPKCESCGQVVQPKREPGTPPAPAPEVMSRDSMPLVEPKAAPVMVPKKKEV